MTRILHTSDWHLGGTSGSVSREADHAHFLDWLGATLVERAVDTLIVAGDVFDQAQPSADAQRLYYRFLGRLVGSSLKKVVVIGGNHDSASRLEAPAEVLAALDVHVVGGLQADEGRWDRCICPVTIDGRVDHVVVAVPFVHEYRLGVTSVLAPEAEIRAAFHERLTRLYRTLTDRACVVAAGAPVIATGHLVAVGCQDGDASSEIHLVGTIGAVPPTVLDPRLSYVALGHLHRMFRVGASPAWYSGSPIPLSVVEGRSPRHVLLVDLSTEVAVTPLVVPQRRELLEVRGPIEEVLHTLAGIRWATPAPPLVSVTVEAEGYDGAQFDRVRRALERGEGRDAPEMIDLQTVNTMKGAASGASAQLPRLSDLDPEQVFRLLCARSAVTVDDALITAFRSLLEEPAADEESRR